MDESLEFEIPPELDAGVYAEVLAARYTAHHMELNFAVEIAQRALLTARIRAPASAILEIRGALEGAIPDDELEFGEIRRPRRRGET